MPERKVTDIVRELESKIQTIGGLTQDTNNNVKLMLDRLNRISKQLENIQRPGPPGGQTFRATAVNTSQRPPSPNAATVQSTVQPPNVNAEMFVAHPVSEQPYEVDDYGKPELAEEVIHKGKRRDLRKPADSGQTKKVAVSQQLLFPDGKAVFLANVEVLTTDGQLVKQTRTNSQGRWIAPLDPGEYTVHILKRMSQDSSKPPVELRYAVQIPESDGPVELPSPSLPDAYAN